MKKFYFSFLALLFAFTTFANENNEKINDEAESVANKINEWFEPIVAWLGTSNPHSGSGNGTAAHVGPGRSRHRRRSE